MISRRVMLAGTVGLAACGPQLARRFNGYCLVANRGSRTLAAVNLTRFKVDKQIPLGSEPGSMVRRADAKAVFLLLPTAGTVLEVPAESLAVSRSRKIAGQAISFRLSGAKLWLLARDPQALIPLDLGSWERGRPIPLPHQALDFDVAPNGQSAVVTYAGRKSCGLIDLRRGVLSGEIALSTDGGIIRFRPDGKQILVGSPAGRTITIADAVSGRVMVVLPMPIGPEQFCFNITDTDNGGQMFVTGPGMDAVSIVYPYQGELAETVLTGRAPGAMTVSDSLLFVANPAAGDVTVMAIAERQIVAKIESGKGPCAVALADEYVLVLNQGSGDMAVVRLSKLTDLRYKRAPLFTVIAVGEDPVAAAVCRL